MTFNGKRDGFTLEDLVAFGAHCCFKRRKTLGMVREIADRVMWMDHGRPKMVGTPADVVDAYRDWSH